MEENNEGRISAQLSRNDIKRKSIHTNVTVVENATRFWLSAQVMIACIMLGMLALSIQDGRGNMKTFSATINSSCVDATYAIKDSIRGSLEELLYDVQNITNRQYQNSVKIARKTVSKSLDMTVDIFMFLVKQMNPLLYCTIDSGLALANTVKKGLSNLRIPDISCEIGKRDTNYTFYEKRGIDLCAMAVDGLNGVLKDVTEMITNWPYLPTSLYDGLDMALGVTGFTQLIQELSHFDAPDTIVNIDVNTIVEKAMKKAGAFDEMAEICTDISFKFDSTTQKTADIMYYIEIAIWTSIVLLLFVIFIVAIVRQFPTAFVDWSTKKMNGYTESWNKKLDNMEKGSIHNWQLYLVWTLKYINFKKAVLTTLYGLAGIILIYNLTSIADTASQPIEIWVNESLGPSFDKIQNTIQKGINQVLDEIEVELNKILQDGIGDNLAPMNTTLNKILREKDKVISQLQKTMQEIKDIPVIGPTVGVGVECMIPLKALGIIDTVVDAMIGLTQDLMTLSINVPSFSFPSLSSIATRSTRMAILQTVGSIQSELKTFEIIFIILSVAFGILVFQGILFVGLRRLAQKIKKERNSVQMRAVNVQ